MNVRYVYQNRFDQFCNSAVPCPNNQQSRKQVTWLFSFLYLFMSERTIHTDLCALSGCVLSILCLFVIKLVQTCRARPPREVTQTPSFLAKKKESLVLIISILWACLSAQNRHLSHPPLPTGHKPHRGLMERTFW